MAQSDTAINQAESAASLPTAMVVEDNKLSRLVLVKNLKRLGYPVIEATNGLQAIEQLRHHPEIGIILMDIKMEEMNGLEATQYIRSFNQEVVIIMQTGFVQDATREEAFAAGCDGFLDKPVDQQVLREYLQRLYPRNINPKPSL